MKIKLADFYLNKKVMITGGLGFIGSNLAHQLVQHGAQVLIIDSLIPGYGGNIFNLEGIRDKVRVNITDIRDQHALEYLVKGQDLIFNLAGQVSHIDSMTDPYTDLEINCKSQLSILEVCRRNNPEAKIIFASTRQIYGRPKYLPVDEKHPICPTDVNGINKMAGEWYHILYHEVYGMQTVSLRLTNTYGPRQLMKHNRQGFIAWFIRQIIDGEKIRIFGTGRQMRDFNYVDDVVEAFLLAGAEGNATGGIYNLGHSQPSNLIDLVKLLIELRGSGEYEIVPFPPEKKRIDIGDFYGDYAKVESSLGWRPRTSLKDGLCQTLEYYQKNKQHYWS